MQIVCAGIWGLCGWDVYGKAGKSWTILPCLRRIRHEYRWSYHTLRPFRSSWSKILQWKNCSICHVWLGADKLIGKLCLEDDIALYLTCPSFAMLKEVELMVKIILIYLLYEIFTWPRLRNDWRLFRYKQAHRIWSLLAQADSIGYKVVKRSFKDSICC